MRISVFPVRIAILATCVMAIYSTSLPGQVSGLVEKEDSLTRLYTRIGSERAAGEQARVNQAFMHYLEEVLHDKNAWEYRFDTLRKRISILETPRKNVRVINWGVETTTGTWMYFGYLVVKKNDSTRVIKLEDKSADNSNPEYTTSNCKNWYGALYYEVIIPEKSNNELVFLGWDGNDLFTNKKIIEILWFDENGEPTFGKPVFNMKGNIKSRVIFEFSENSTMVLRWEPRLHMVVFDHLSPSNTLYEGHKEYYGSDFSFDGLTEENKGWKLVEDLDMRNQRKKKKAN